MDGGVFDRIVMNLAGHRHRREALRALAAGGVLLAGGSFDAEQAAGKKKKKKRERKLGQTCGGKKKCSKKNGPAVCQEFGSSLCVGVTLTGNRCCGLEGSKCDPNFGVSPEPDPVNSVGNCSCCEPLFCGTLLDGEFRCQVEPT
jgi:hypothetical protein